MSLHITYKDGTVRIVNVTKDFYNDPETEVRKKALTIAHDTGIPYKIVLYRGNKLFYNKIFENNAPVEKVEPLKVSEAVKNFEKNRLKKFKNETKGKKLRVILHITT